MKDQLRRGAAFAVAGAAAFACMSALVKLAGSDLPNPVIVFFRNLFAPSFGGGMLVIAAAPIVVVVRRHTPRRSAAA